MKKPCCFLFTLIFIFVFAACTYPVETGTAVDREVSKNIYTIDLFPDIPVRYSYYDYEAAALALDDVIFAFAEDSAAHSPSYVSSDSDSWNPVGFWIDQTRSTGEYDPLVTGYLRRSFGLPTYVGDTRVISSGSEPLTMIAMVLGSSYAGLDKSSETMDGTLYDFVEMTFSGYDTGSQLVHNSGAQGQSFWYDIFPQILFARLYALYPDTEYMKEMVLNGADQWLEALPYFVDDSGNVSFGFVGYNVVLESPTVTGEHLEPPNGGLAFLFYSAYEITGEEKYLLGCEAVLDYFQNLEWNPNYEALTDYAPYVAAILNARYGTGYDVGKFLDFLFEGDSAYRSGWSVLSGSFGDYAIDGLVGQSGDYAFSMNSFHLASVLAPMVKYDTRYATAVGKYLLNLVSNAQVFFSHQVSLSHQTMEGYLGFDPDGSLCYEGFRNSYSGITGLAMGDATAMFSLPCDLSVYSSAFIGFLGGMVEETDVEGILQIDLDATDGFGLNRYPEYLYYNPYSTDQTIRFEGTDETYDLYDAVTKRIVARNVSGTCDLRIPARSSAVIVVLPAGSELVREGNSVYADGTLIASYQASVTLPGLASRTELTSDSVIDIACSVPVGDSVATMSISFGDILVYSGEPLTAFQYDKSLLPDTDYTLTVRITTANGLTDYVTKRVVCR